MPGPGNGVTLAPGRTVARLPAAFESARGAASKAAIVARGKSDGWGLARALGAVAVVPPAGAWAIGASARGASEVGASAVGASAVGVSGASVSSSPSPAAAADPIAAVGLLPPNPRLTRGSAATVDCCAERVFRDRPGLEGTSSGGVTADCLGVITATRSRRGWEERSSLGASGSGSRASSRSKFQILRPSSTAPTPAVAASATKPTALSRSTTGI